RWRPRAALGADRRLGGRDVPAARGLLDRGAPAPDGVPTDMTTLCFVSALAAAALGIFVSSRTPRHVANLAFAWGMVALSAADIAFVMLLKSAQPADRAVWLEAALVAGALMLPGWSVFSVTFGRANPRAELRRRRWPLAAIAGLATAVPLVAARFPLAAAPNPYAADVVPLSVYGNAIAICTLLTTVFVL